MQSCTIVPNGYAWAGAGFGIGASVSFSTNILDVVFSVLGFGPLVLDLNGDGVNIVPRFDSTAYFDADGDGFREQTAWAGPGDGILVYDSGPNGSFGPDNVINQPQEIAFAQWTADPNDTDAQALASVFDTNHNGQLDPGDAYWNELRIWIDSNQNGTTDSGELRADSGSTGGDAKATGGGTSKPYLAAYAHAALCGLTVRFCPIA